MADQRDKLPKNWIARESTSKPGRFYYANCETGVSTWKREDVFGSNSSVHVPQLVKTSSPPDKKKNDIDHSIIPKFPKELEKQFIKSQTPKDLQICEKHQPHHKGKKKFLANATNKDGSIAKNLEQTPKLNKILKQNSPAKHRTIHQPKPPLPSCKKSLSKPTTHLSGSRSSSAICIEKNLKGNSTVADYMRRDTNHSSKSSVSETSLYTKKLPISSKEKKAAGYEDQFNKLVSKSASKSKDYVSLEGPMGSKHVKTVTVDKKFTGPMPSIKFKVGRFTPFPISCNKKEASHSDKTRKSKSEVTLVLEKFETIFPDVGSQHSKDSRHKKQHQAQQKQQQQQTPQHSHQQQQPHQQARKQTPQHQQQYQQTIHHQNQQQPHQQPTTHSQQKQKHEPQHEQSCKQKYQQPHQQGLPPQIQQNQQSIQQQPHKQRLQCQSQPSYGTPIRAQSTDTGFQNGDMQRVLNFSMDDDWDMMSNSSLEEEASSEIPLVSFDLNSDVVMATISRDVVADNSAGGEPMSTAELRVCVVIDTCSMGNLQSFLQVRYVSLDSQESEEVLEYSLYRVVIPWQVLQELDFLKDNKTGAFSTSKQNGAKRVARLIHTELSRKSSIVKLQSPIDDAAMLDGFRIQTEDDHIIKCCLSLKSKLGAGHAVVLMTEDINLINKCVACDIQASQYNVLRRKCRTQPNNSATSSGKNNTGPKATTIRSKVYESALTPAPARSAASTPARPATPPKAIIKPYSPQTPRRVESWAVRSRTQSLVGDSGKDGINLRSLAEKHSPKKTEEQIYGLLAKLEAIIKPILCKCLAIEMSAAFGNNWEMMVLKKPPWTTLLPVLESLNKHWLAVFGQVLNRHTVKSVKILLDLYSRKFSPNTEGLVDGVISAISLTRALDKSARGYAAEARALLPQLNQLLHECRDEIPHAEAAAGTIPESAHSLPAAVNEDLTTDVVGELTKIFTALASACETIEYENIRGAGDVVIQLGSAFQSAMNIPMESPCVKIFLDELCKVAQLLSLQVSLSLDGLCKFISANRQLMLEGLSQLENLAQSLQQKL